MRASWPRKGQKRVPGRGGLFLAGWGSREKPSAEKLSEHAEGVGLHSPGPVAFGKHLDFILRV